MLGENTNCYVCDWAEEICSTYVVTAYRVAGLYVNMLKDNIEMGIKGKVLVIKCTENYLSTHIHNIIIVSHDI